MGQTLWTNTARLEAMLAVHGRIVEIDAERFKLVDEIQERRRGSTTSVASWPLPGAAGSRLSRPRSTISQYDFTENNILKIGNE